MKIARYDTCLTNAQWAFLKPLLPALSRRGRPSTDRRRVINAILYITKGRIQWRLLPHDFPSWKTVYHVFRKWIREGVWECLNDSLREKVRQAAGRNTHPTAAVLDSQSVKSDSHGGAVGYDAGKRIKGRKRHLLVDTLGLLLGIELTPASTPERAGAQTLLQRVLKGFAGLALMWVDGGYTGENFADWVRGIAPGLEVEVVKRSDDIKGFKLLPRRWVVERTFGWLMRHRRLVRDYEASDTSAQAFAYIAIIRIQLRRLA